MDRSLPQTALHISVEGIGTGANGTRAERRHGQGGDLSAAMGRSALPTLRYSAAIARIGGSFARTSRS